MIALGLALAAGAVIARLRGDLVIPGACCTLGLIRAPSLALLIGAVLGLLWLSRKLHRQRMANDAADHEVLALSQGVGIGLSAGLSPVEALSRAQGLLSSSLLEEVESVLRHATLVGAGRALADAEGRAEPLYRMMSRAVRTGAPLGPAVESATSEILADRLAARLADARRLPVRLMVPIALAILPGFVLMTLGPVINEAIDQFGF